MAAVIRRPERGFTVLEFVVAATLMLIVLGLTLDLIVRSHQRLDHAGFRSRDLPVDLVFDRIRLDVRSSRGVVTVFASTGLWSRDPLVTSGRRGGDVAYALVGDELVRHPALSSDPSDRVRVLDRVETFRWRRVEETARETVEIEITFREAGPLTARTGATQRGVGRERSERFVVTPRDVEASWW